jgi:septal ring factor EnvC (AmiA/AmiB activator)
MKSQLLAALALSSAAVLCGFAFAPQAPQDPNAARIEKLEKDLAASRLRVEALSTDVADLKKQMAATVQYLQLQAHSAATMQTVLDDSENQGFTYGINPNSRHVLLRGWREQLAAAQKDVPAPEAQPENPAPPKTNAKTAKPMGAEKAPGD